MTRTLAMLCVLAALPAAAAGAEPAPRVLPGRDVTVSYRVSGPAMEAIPFLGAGNAPSDMRLSWNAGSQRLMVSAPGRAQRLLVDLPGHRATVLDDGMRAALFLPMRDTDVQGLTMANARFTRRGTAQVAGERCTEWDVRSNRSAGTVCITGDGVPLRGEGDVNGRHGAFTATAVNTSPVDPAGLAVPAGYNRIEMPSFGGR